MSSMVFKNIYHSIYYVPYYADPRYKITYTSITSHLSGLFKSDAVMQVYIMNTRDLVTSQVSTNLAVISSVVSAFAKESCDEN